MIPKPDLFLFKRLYITCDHLQRTVGKKKKKRKKIGWRSYGEICSEQSYTSGCA